MLLRFVVAFTFACTPALLAQPTLEIHVDPNDIATQGFRPAATFFKVLEFKARVGRPAGMTGGFGGLVIGAWLDNDDARFPATDVPNWLSRQTTSAQLLNVAGWNGTPSHDLAVWRSTLQAYVDLNLKDPQGAATDIGVRDWSVPFLTGSGQGEVWRYDPLLWVLSTTYGHGMGFASYLLWHGMLSDAVTDSIDQPDVFRAEAVFRSAAFLQAGFAGATESDVNTFFETQTYASAMQENRIKVLVQAVSYGSTATVNGASHPLELPRLDGFPTTPVCTDLSAPAVIVVDSRPPDQLSHSWENGNLQPGQWAVFDAAQITPTAEIQFPVANGGTVWRRVRSISDRRYPNRHRVKVPGQFVPGFVVIRTGTHPTPQPLGWLSPQQ